MSAGEGPFRWDPSRRAQLGTLLRGEPAEQYPGFLGDLRECCARVVARAGDGRPVFVGRSPESIHDYLAGALVDTSCRGRGTLLNLSVHLWSMEAIGREGRGGVRALQAQLRDLGIDPASVAAAPRPVVLVDLVWSGGTLGVVQELLVRWAGEEGVDPAAVRRRLRFVGIIARHEHRPRHALWSRHLAWTADYRPGVLRSVAVPWRLWDYLDNRQSKVARWHPPFLWGSEEMRKPPREREHLEALRLAVRVHEQGREAEERGRLAAALAAQPEMRERWLRRLVAELRAGCAAGRREERRGAGGRRWVRRGGPRRAT
ncbi:MAG: hypothetical protein AB1941_03085 [Gemmatimonadota bacterium]